MVPTRTKLTKVVFIKNGPLLLRKNKSCPPSPPIVNVDNMKSLLQNLQNRETVLSQFFSV